MGARHRGAMFGGLVYILHASAVALPGLASQPRRRAELAPLLTTISNTPELSVFYSLFNSTGGDSGIPGPALEERFNDPNISLDFTAFAPTNNAFANLSPEMLAILTAPTSYELLHSLLINHIAPGNLSVQDLEASVHAVGGFDISFSSKGEVTTNPGLATSDQPEEAKRAGLVKGEDGQPKRILASNGVVYAIDHVLDGLLTYLGSDAPANNDTLPVIIRQSGTMQDILEENAELSILKNTWDTINPDFLTRLSLTSGKTGEAEKTVVYLAPGNAAFEVLPKQALHKAVQPSNYGLAEFLLAFGLGVVDDGETSVKSTSQFEIVLRDGRANNALIEQRICAENGCVWILGRWLDPLFGIF